MPHPLGQKTSIKDIASKIGRFVWTVFAGTAVILSWADAPRQVKAWQNWISEAFAWTWSSITGEHLEIVGQNFDLVFSNLDRWWIKFILLTTALAAIFWRTKIFLELRRDAIFQVRHVMTDQVWRSREEAVRIVHDSRWAVERRNRSAKPKKRNFIEITSSYVLMDDPARDALNNAFWHWCRLALNTFAESNPDAFRTADGEKQYDEALLRSYLKERYDQDVITEFGEPY